MTKTLSFVTIDTWTLIFTWVNLGILLLLMKKFLFKPITEIIRKREQEINEMYAQAEKDKNDSMSMKEMYSQKLSNAKKEAGDIVSTATRTAELRSEQIVKEAQNKAAIIMEKADEEIKNEKKAAVEEIKSDISVLAVSIASKVIEKDLSETDHNELVENCINKMGESL